jgi:hypothetical protein
VLLSSLDVTEAGPDSPLRLAESTLDGLTAVTHHAVAAALTAAGRPVPCPPMSRAELADLMTGRGFTAGYGTFLAEALGRVATGEPVIPVADTVRG